MGWKRSCLRLDLSLLIQNFNIKGFYNMTTYNTHDYGMLAETVTIKSRNDDFVSYLAKPLGKGPFPTIVLVSFTRMG